MRGPRWQLAAEARVELVERIWYRVLADWRLDLAGKLVEAVVEQERTLDVWIHGMAWSQLTLVRSGQDLLDDLLHKQARFGVMLSCEVQMPTDEINGWPSPLGNHSESDRRSTRYEMPPQTDAAPLTYYHKQHLDKHIDNDRPHSDAAWDWSSPLGLAIGWLARGGPVIGRL